MIIKIVHQFHLLHMNRTGEGAASLIESIGSIIINEKAEGHLSSVEMGTAFVFKVQNDSRESSSRLPSCENKLYRLSDRPTKDFNEQFFSPSSSSDELWTRSHIYGFPGPQSTTGKEGSSLWISGDNFEQSTMNGGFDSKLYDKKLTNESIKGYFEHDFDLKVLSGGKKMLGSARRRNSFDDGQLLTLPLEKRQLLYKTEICRALEETGMCRYGEKCQFAHSKDELRVAPRHPRYKTEVCRTYWELGTCPYGKRCCFIHNEPYVEEISNSDKFKPDEDVCFMPNYNQNDFKKTYNHKDCIKTMTLKMRGGFGDESTESEDSMSPVALKNNNSRLLSMFRRTSDSFSQSWGSGDGSSHTNIAMPMINHIIKCKKESKTAICSPEDWSTGSIEISTGILAFLDE